MVALRPAFAALCLLAPAAFAQTTHLDDAFADGDRTTQAPPASVTWFSSAGSSSIDTSAAAHPLTLLTGGSGRHVLAYFTAAEDGPVPLAVGQILELRLELTLDAPIVPDGTSNNSLRLALLDSRLNGVDANVRVVTDGHGGTGNGNSEEFNPYAGYRADVLLHDRPSSATAPLSLRERLPAASGTANALLLANPAYGPEFASGGTLAVVPAGDYTATLTVTRPAADRVTVVAAFRHADESIVFNATGEDTADPVTSFDTVAVGANSNVVASFTVRRAAVVVFGEGEPEAAPTIVTPPADQTAAVGADVTFTVSAQGQPAPTFQWRKDDTDLPGATAATLALTHVAPEDAGLYRVVVTNSAGSVTSAPATLTVLVDPDSEPEPRPVPPAFANLSSRGRSSDGDQVLITGFVIGGTTPKRLLIRAAGPALAPLGIVHPLPDPTLSLHRDDTLLHTNRDWSDADGDVAGVAASFGAFPFAAGSSDAALLVTLEPGSYTTHVAGGTGVTLLELYQAPAGHEEARLLNVSTRGKIGAGENVLIGGFVIPGPDERTVLVRGIGPALTPFGVHDALVDPLLTVRRDQQIIAINDNWSAPDSPVLAEAFAVNGAFSLPDGSADAALLLTLAPGAYTAVVDSADGSSGVALIEIYDAMANGSAPTILRSPVSQALEPGAEVTLEVFAVGLADLAYQWSKDGTPLTGATTPQLTLPAVHATDAGAYTVRVSNPDGVALSTPAYLTVTTPAAPPARTARVDDTFARAARAGWGPAAAGLTYTLDGGTPGDFFAAGNAGRITLSDTSPRRATLDLDLFNTEGVVTIDLGDAPALGATTAGVTARVQAAGAHYAFQLRRTADGSTGLRLERHELGVATPLGSEVAIAPPGTAHRFHLRFRAASASPTHLAAKAWPVGSAEPAAWSTTATDATVTLQAAGDVGVVAAATAAAANAGARVAYHRLLVHDTAFVPDLRAALLEARAGDIIYFTGEHTGHLATAAHGTAAAPIIVRGIDALSRSPARTSGYGLEVRHDHWRFDNFTLTHAKKAFYAFGASHGVLTRIRATDIGDEAFKFRRFSRHWEVDDCHADGTGVTLGEFGEGFYVGDAASNWPDANTPDTSGYITFRGCTTRNTTNDGFDVKEGARFVKFIDCVADFSGPSDPAVDAATGNSGFYLRGDDIQIIRCTVNDLGPLRSAFKIANQLAAGADFGNRIELKAIVGRDLGGPLLEILNQRSDNVVLYDDYSVENVALLKTGSGSYTLRAAAEFEEPTW